MAPARPAVQRWQHKRHMSTPPRRVYARRGVKRRSLTISPGLDLHALRSDNGGTSAGPGAEAAGTPPSSGGASCWDSPPRPRTRTHACVPRDLRGPPPLRRQRLGPRRRAPSRAASASGDARGGGADPSRGGEHGVDYVSGADHGRGADYVGVCTSTAEVHILHTLLERELVGQCHRLDAQVLHSCELLLLGRVKVSWELRNAGGPAAATRQRAVLSLPAGADVETGPCLRLVAAEQTSGLPRIVGSFSDHDIRVFDVMPHGTVHRWSMSGAHARSVFVLSTHGNLVAAASLDGLLTVHDLDSHDRLLSMQSPCTRGGWSFAQFWRVPGCDAPVLWAGTSDVLCAVSIVSGTMRAARVSGLSGPAEFLFAHPTVRDLLVVAVGTQASVSSADGGGSQDGKKRTLEAVRVDTSAFHSLLDAAPPFAGDVQALPEHHGARVLHVVAQAPAGDIMLSTGVCFSSYGEYMAYAARGSESGSCCVRVVSTTPSSMFEALSVFEYGTSVSSLCITPSDGLLLVGLSSRFVSTNLFHRRRPREFNLDRRDPVFVEWMVLSTARGRLTEVLSCTSGEPRLRNINALTLLPSNPGLGVFVAHSGERGLEMYSVLAHCE